MESYLRRTHKTNLSDEELTILDVLFEAGDTFESLVKENYATWHNLSYSHPLEDAALRDLVDKLISKGTLTAHTSGSEDRIFYALTEAGGKLWEVERAPDWERYCTDSSQVDEDGNWTLRVESPSITTAKAFVECANACLLYRFNLDEMRTTTSIQPNVPTVYWKTFPKVYSISVATFPSSIHHQTDWNEYESRRTWWRSLTELAKFQAL